MKATPSTVARRAAFLRAVAAAPQPDEPVGLGAIVRAANGDLYIRAKATTLARHWTNAYGMNDHTRYRWDQLPGPLEVVSEGEVIEP